MNTETNKIIPSIENSVQNIKQNIISLYNTLLVETITELLLMQPFYYYCSISKVDFFDSAITINKYF